MAGTIAYEYPAFANEFYDDFNRADTAAGTLGTAPVGGGVWDLRGPGATSAATAGRIQGGKFTSAPGEVIYAVQTLTGNANRIGARISWAAGNAGASLGVAAFLISPAKTGAALIANAGVHIQVSRVSIIIQSILGGSFPTYETKVFPTQLSLDTPYVVDIEVDGPVVRYSCAGVQGAVVNKDLQTAGLGKYVTWEHFYASSSVSEVVRFESVWASSSLVGKATMSELCVAAYKFSTTAWADATGRGNTLVGVNTPTIGTGIVGNGVSLAAASSQSLSVASNNDFRLNGKDWSISAWVNPTAITGTGYMPIFDKSSGSVLEYSLRMDKGTGRCWIAASPDGTLGSVATTGAAAALTPGAFNHVFASYDSQLGILGVSVNNGTMATAVLPSVFNGTNSFKVGTSVWLGNPFFDGIIDEMYLFTSPPGHGGALSPTRRALLYNSGEGLSWPLAS